MADRKITDLTALAAGSQATGDLLTIVDVSESAAADKNKKITVESLFKGIPGDVGIGTSSPSAMLHVNGGAASTNPHLRISADRGLIARLGDTSGAAQSLFDLYDTDGSTQIVKFTNGSGADFINTGGNLGIGTSSPLSQLHVSSSTGNADTRVGGTSSALGLEFSYDQSGSTVSKITSNPTYTNTAARLHICVDGDANADQLVLNGAGNVGIGTSSPGTSKLYVLGDTTNYGVKTEAPSGYGSLTLQQTSGNSMSLGMISNDLFVYDNNAASTRVTLDSSGNVGIGTSSPGHVLTVRVGTANQAIANFTGATVGRGLVIKTSNDGGTGDDTVIYNATESTGLHVFEVNSSERMRILSGGGITFNGDTAAANALDDYEEGTWNITNGGDSTGVISTSHCKYTKIGRVVVCHFVIKVSANFTSSTLGGLPFAPANVSGAPSAVHGLIVVRSAGSGSFFFQINNDSTISTLANSSGSTLATLSTSTDPYRGTFTYQTA